MTARVLIADDEDSLRWVLEKGLRQAGYEVTSVKDGPGAIQAFEAEPFDLVFLDVRMPGVDGLTALARLREVRPDATVVVMTAHGTMDTAIQAMQRGAYDYLAKPFDLDEVVLLAERALAARRLTQEVIQLKSGLHEVWEFGALIGRHPRMQDVYKTIGRVASRDVTVLLRGESGTGKELVARAIHHYSRRAGRPFVAVSCAAIPGPLLESEMFGHERGAFTAGSSWRTGERSTSTRSATCPSTSRRSCCDRSRSARSSAWAGPTRSASTRACSRRPTATSKRSCGRDASARICTTA